MADLTAYKVTRTGANKHTIDEFSEKYNNVLDWLDNVYIYEYYPDSTETDQGVTGDGATVAAYLTTIGTTNKATIRFTHNTANEYTDYTVSTSIDMTNYDNVQLKFEAGARLTIDSAKDFKFPSPMHITASEFHTIFTGAGTVYGVFIAGGDVSGTGAGGAADEQGGSSATPLLWATAMFTAGTQAVTGGDILRVTYTISAASA